MPLPSQPSSSTQLPSRTKCSAYDGGQATGSPQEICDSVADCGDHAHWYAFSPGGANWPALRWNIIEKSP